ncbi:MAG: ABC-2 type transport system permease protein [Sulfurimonas sp.]|jgi:ABC-2 type transport system permease protein
MFEALSKAFIKELQSIKNSYYKLLLVTILPIVSFTLLIATLYDGVLRDMPIAVIDNDKSSLSREVLKNIEASPTIKIRAMLSSTKEAIKLAQESKVYAVVVIPKDFQKDTTLQKQPSVTAMINTQYILVGKIITSSLTKTIRQNAAQVEYIKNLKELQIPYSTINSISPIGLQITPYFNTFQNYFIFLISALLPAIWQIFIVVATIVSFGSMFKNKEEKKYLDTTYLFSCIIGKLLPYTVIYLFFGILYLFYIYGTLGWVFQGSITFTIFGMFLTVVAYQAMALLLFVTGFDYARSLSLGALYTAPAFAFLGVTFPVYNMNGFAEFWRDILPVSHYMQLQISQANYGANIFLDFDKLLHIFSFWLAFLVVYFMFKRKLSK